MGKYFSNISLERMRYAPTFQNYLLMIFAASLAK